MGTYDIAIEPPLALSRGWGIHSRLFIFIGSLVMDALRPAAGHDDGDSHVLGELEKLLSIHQLLISFDNKKLLAFISTSKARGFLASSANAVDILSELSNVRGVEGPAILSA